MLFLLNRYFALLSVSNAINLICCRVLKSLQNVVMTAGNFSLFYSVKVSSSPATLTGGRLIVFER